MINSRIKIQIKWVVNMGKARDVIEKLNTNLLDKDAVEQLYIHELTYETFEQIIEALNKSFLTSYVKELHLSFSSNSGIPASIKCLDNLNAIVIQPSPSATALTCIPESLRTLPKLMALVLSGHQISIVPLWIGELIELRTLNLSHNNISSLPSQIGDLINLRSLDISRNPLTSIPRSITVLPYLDTLDIRETSLTNAPLTLFLNQKITRFCEPSLLYPDLELYTKQNIINTTIKFHLVFRILRNIPQLTAQANLVGMIVKNSIWNTEFDSAGIYHHFLQEYIGFARDKKTLTSRTDTVEYLKKVLNPNLSLNSIFNVSWQEAKDHDPAEVANKYHFIGWYID